MCLNSKSIKINSKKQIRKTNPENKFAINKSIKTNLFSRICFREFVINEFVFWSVNLFLVNLFLWICCSDVKFVFLSICKYVKQICFNLKTNLFSKQICFIWKQIYCFSGKFVFHRFVLGFPKFPQLMHRCWGWCP